MRWWNGCTAGNERSATVLWSSCECSGSVGTSPSRCAGAISPWRTTLLGQFCCLAATCPASSCQPCSPVAPPRGSRRALAQPRSRVCGVVEWRARLGLRRDGRRPRGRLDREQDAHAQMSGLDDARWSTGALGQARRGERRGESRRGRSVSEQDALSARFLKRSRDDDDEQRERLGGLLVV